MNKYNSFMILASSEYVISTEIRQRELKEIPRGKQLKKSRTCSKKNLENHKNHKNFRKITKISKNHKHFKFQNII